jgi:hypothetical protein
MKNINQLEKERIEKINNLNIDEVKSYIKSLNKKIFKALDEGNLDEIDYLNEKLSEIYKVTKYNNLEVFSTINKLDITSAKMIENNTKKHNIFIVFNAQIFLLADIILQEIYLHLDYILMIYYHNYYLMESAIVEDLLIKLEIDYDFKDDNFSQYANSRVKKHNDVLMEELDCLISRLKQFINHTIEMTELQTIKYSDDDIASVLKDIDSEIQFLIKKGASDDGVKILKDGEYYDLLEKLRKSYIHYDECLKSYIETKEKVLNYINSDDGFAEMKETDYEFVIETCGKCTVSKEDFIAMRPSYDMKKCEFVESSYLDDLKSDDE